MSSAAVEAAPGHEDIARVIAPNPGPMTLAGTNTYVVGSDPAWVIDPGPADPAHVERVRAEAERRGGIGGVLITHAHVDHTAGAELLDAPVLVGSTKSRDEGELLAEALEESKVRPVRGSHPADETEAGPFEAISTPGHATDHVVLVRDGVCFCGDLILGEGSSIVPPAAAGGSLADYMRSLDRVEELAPSLLCPGHGPWITDPPAKIAQYREHRLDRERRLVAALDAGETSRDRLLEAGWSDVPEAMRPMAALAMQAHLEKLSGEGRRLLDLEP